MSNPTTLPCPPWCTRDHAKHDRFEQYIGEDGFSPIDLRTHAVKILTLPNPSCGKGSTVDVEVAITDDLGAGTRGPTEVTVDGGECMSPELARAVAASLLVAVDVAVYGDLPPRTTS